MCYNAFKPEIIENNRGEFSRDYGYYNIILTFYFLQQQEPLTASTLAGATPSEQKQMIGERLFPLVQEHQPKMAGKITGMLLEIDNGELLNMLENRELLKDKVGEAVAVLQAHQAKEAQNQAKAGDQA